MKFFVGGEPIYNPLILFTKKKYDLDDYMRNRFNYKYRYYTGGGIHSLYQILKNIDFDNDGICLLPSYLCPSILKPFDELKINYKFYKINAKLEIDNDYLVDTIDANTKAVLFINYFGFPLSSKNEELLILLKGKGIILIQDLVQGFYSDLNQIGDYCFNSFRKFLPADGSVILSNTPMIINQSFKNYRYLFHKTIGQFLRFISFWIGIDLAKHFIKQFQFAHKYYYTSYNSKFLFFSKHIIERIELNSLSRRKDYYDILSNEFYYRTLFKQIPKNVIPLGFPVLLRNRNDFRKDLTNKNIFCPVHWNLSNEISEAEFQESYWLSKNIITLPINESIDKNNFSKYCELIKGAL